MNSTDFIVDQVSALQNYFDPRTLKKLTSRLERVSFKIAPLNNLTGNTQTMNRWELKSDHPHFASEDECQRIFAKLVDELVGLISKNAEKVLAAFNGDDNVLNKEILIEQLNSSSRIGSSDLPIWYKTDLSQGGKHTVENITWTNTYPELLILRKAIRDKALITKIQVKAYLTDRRQTGEYQTNREIRWETLPQSPQYSSKVDCMEIEAKLLAQIFTFTGAPSIQEDILQTVETVLGQKYYANSFRCPLSGKAILYNEFLEKVTSPTHGRSGYQVGHLSPLASTGRHDAGNISWITDLGNRVQGESSLEEITNDIFFMADFHRNRLNLTWDQVTKIAKSNES